MSENIKDALEYAVGLSKQEDMTVISETGKEFYDAKLHRLEELDPIKYPAPLELNSLSSLVAYIKGKLDVDDFEKKRFIINVESPTTVSFESELDADQGRAVYAIANAITPQFNWDHFYDIESFNIKLVSAFVKTEERALMLELSSKVKVENGVELSDDGVSQIATVKNGIASVHQAKLPNPVALKPYRTFLEVNQPTSEFVFRLNDQPGAALFEADGSMWKLEAKANIAAYLQNELSEMNNITVLS